MTASASYAVARVTHYNTARPRQGIAQHVPAADRDAPRATGTDPGTARIRRRPVLGSLINEYTHAAGPTENPQVTSRILFPRGTGSCDRQYCSVST